MGSQKKNGRIKGIIPFTETPSFTVPVSSASPCISLFFSASHWLLERERWWSFRLVVPLISGFPSKEGGGYSLFNQLTNSLLCWRTRDCVPHDSPLSPLPVSAHIPPPGISSHHTVTHPVARKADMKKWLDLEIIENFDKTLCPQMKATG